MDGELEFHEATMRELITDWLTLAEDYDTSLNSGQALVQVRGPGLDFASRSHAKAANDSGQAYLDYLQNNRDYCLEQAQLLHDALHDYLGVERTSVTEMGDVGQSLDDGPRAGVRPCGGRHDRGLL